MSVTGLHHASMALDHVHVCRTREHRDEDLWQQWPALARLQGRNQGHLRRIHRRTAVARVAHGDLHERLCQQACDWPRLSLDWLPFLPLDQG